MIKKFLLAVLMVLTITSFAFATQPLITDTAVTEGKGNVKVEVGATYTYDERDDVDIDTWIVPGKLSVGLLSNVDFVVSDAWVNIDPEDMDSVDGMKDINLALKVNVLNYEGWFVSLKPNVSLPSGDEDKGLSDGETKYGIQALVTKQLGPVLVHVNGGYNTVDDRIDASKDIWSASIAGEYKLAEKWTVVAEGGVIDDYGFGGAGIIWTACKYADVSLGVRTGPNVDVTGIGGITIRF